MGEKSQAFLGYQCSCRQSALCHAAEAVVMAISSVVMDSGSDNGWNTLSVPFVRRLTCSPCRLPLNTTHCSHTLHRHARARTQAHRFRQSRWQSVGAWSWSILSWECMNLITAFLQRINKWAWPEGMKRRRRRRHDLIIPNQKSGQIMSGRWKGLFPPGWGGVGFKHQAPAAAHDSADIVA